MTSNWPYLARKQRVGLFGGTFDPVHEGHVLVAQRAQRACDLDQIWWIPSHGNPLKSRQPTAIADRMDAIHVLAPAPWNKPLDVEALTKARYTVDQISQLKRRYPTVQFVLIIGADLVDELPRWRGWQQLALSVPICVIARPGQQLRAGHSTFATVFRHARLAPKAAKGLADKPAPAWVLLPGAMSNQSSSKIRAANSL